MILLPDYDVVTSFLVPIILLQNMTSNVLEYPRILFTSVLYLKVESLKLVEKKIYHLSQFISTTSTYLGFFYSKFNLQLNWFMNNEKLNIINKTSSSTKVFLVTEDYNSLVTSVMIMTVRLLSTAGTDKHDKLSARRKKRMKNRKNFIKSSF